VCHLKVSPRGSKKLPSAETAAGMNYIDAGQLLLVVVGGRSTSVKLYNTVGGEYIKGSLIYFKSLALDSNGSTGGYQGRL